MMLLFYGLCGLILLGTLLYEFSLFRYHIPFRKWSLLIRMTGILILLSLLPFLNSRNAPFKPVLPVVIDNSVSLLQGVLRQNLSTTTLQNPESLLPPSIMDELTQHYDGYALKFIPLFPPANSSQTPVVKTSPLSSRLMEWLQETSLPSGSRMLLISDGYDTGQEQIMPDVLTQLRQSGITVDVPDFQSFSLKPGDSGIHSVVAPQVAFEKTQVSIQLQISYHTLQDQETFLVLTDGNAVLSRQRIILEPGKNQMEASISWIPPRTGNVVLQLRLLPLPKDPNLYNNTAYLPVSIRPLKQKILHIAGRPGWDVSRMRTLLTHIPGVDLVSFYILRDPYEDFQGVPESELSLIQFPVSVLFQTELPKFDAVIFHNFPIQKYLNNQAYQQSFQNYLKNGKQIIVIGGDLLPDITAYQALFTANEDAVVFDGWQHQAKGVTAHIPHDWNPEKQPFFQWTAQNADTTITARSSYDLGKVTWIWETASWKWLLQDLSASTGQNGMFPSFWGSLLNQVGNPVLPLFEPGPFFHQEPIQILFSKPSKTISTLAVSLYDQGLNHILWEKSQDWNSPLNVLLPHLSEGVYEVKISCHCSTMRDYSEPFVVVDEWLEQHYIGINRNWLNELASVTGGDQVSIEL
ncbi:MAG: hypothetical protein HQM12_06600 [SAR324 cluster bacterium]|nr:hypothetical protein [SAR324 cluster bacterium]